MRTYNLANIIPVNTVMNATINSPAQEIWNMFIYSIQIFFTGTPTGSFKLQASNDPISHNAAVGSYSGNATAPTHWTDIANSTFTVSAAGDVMWTVENPGYNWVRVVYTDTSGGTSTAVIASATMNGKGF